MAYRKTESVLAEIAGRKTKIVNAAIAVISKHGAAALTSDRVAIRAKVSVGLIYRHFPDMDELRAHIFALLLARDLDLIREAGDLTQAISLWARQLAEQPHITVALARDVAYRNGVKIELAKMIRSATGSGDSAIFAAVVTGAVFEVAPSLKPRGERILIGSLLRAIGVRSRSNA